MALDSSAERLDAALSIASESDLVVEFEIPTYTDEIKTGSSTVYAHAIVEESKPSKDRDIVNEDLVLTVSALQADSSGNLLATTLTLSRGDMVVWNGKRLPIIRENPVKPTGVIIMYDGLVAGIRKAAP